MTGLNLNSTLYSGKAGNEAGKIKNLKSKLSRRAPGGKKVSGTDFSSLLALKSGSKKDTKEACYQLESLVVKSMLDNMRKNIQKSKLIGGGMAEDIFEDMLYNEYALMISREGGNNSLAEIIYRDIEKAKGTKLRSGSKAASR